MERRGFNVLAQVLQQRPILVLIFGLLVIDADDVRALAEIEGLNLPLPHLAIELLTGNSGAETLMLHPDRFAEPLQRKIREVYCEVHTNNRQGKCVYSEDRLNLSNDLSPSHLPDIDN